MCKADADDLQHEEALERRVLLVDDSTDILGLLREYIFTCGAGVYTAENGVDALVVFQQHPEIVVVVSDRQMGGGPKDGDALYAGIKEELTRRHGMFILLHGGVLEPDSRAFAGAVIRDKLHAMQRNGSEGPEIVRLVRAGLASADRR